MKKIFLISLLILSGSSFAQNISIERYTLKNGLEVYFMQTGSLPASSVSLFVNTGKKNETPGQQYISALTAATLLQGNSKHSLIEQDNLLNEMGSSLSASSNYNFTRIDCRFLNKDLERGFELFASAVLSPLFPEEEVTQEIKQTLDFSNLSKIDIGTIADIYSDYFVFGSSNPLGRRFYAKQLSAATSATVKEFYKFNYTPKNCRLVIAGKIEKEAVRKLIEQYFGNWNAEYGEVNGASYEVPEMKKKEYAFVNKEGATQAALHWTKKSPQSDSKDLLPFLLANSVFSKNLFDEIRVKEGKTYGIYSTYSQENNTGTFEIASQVRAEVMLGTTESFDRVLKDFYEKGVTEEQLSVAKTEYKNQYTSLEDPLDFIGFFNPLIFPDPNKRLQYLQDIDKVSLAAINKIIKKYFNPANYKVVISGDETLLKDQLAKIPALVRLAPSNIETDGAEPQEGK